MPEITREQRQEWAKKQAEKQEAEASANARRYPGWKREQERRATRVSNENPTAEQ